MCVHFDPGILLIQVYPADTSTCVQGDMITDASEGLVCSEFSRCLQHQHSIWTGILNPSYSILDLAPH